MVFLRRTHPGEGRLVEGVLTLLLVDATLISAKFEDSTCPRSAGVMRRVLLVVWVVGLWCAIATESWSATVTISAHGSGSWVKDGALDSGHDLVVNQSTELPIFDTLVATHGNSQSTTLVEFWTRSVETTFNHQFDHEFAGIRTIGRETFARSSSTVRFTPSADVYYSLTGTYSMSGTGEIRMAAVLQGLFLHAQEETGTDITLTTSASGTLPAGQEYVFVFDTGISHPSIHSVNEATATGHVTLTLTDAQIIPEPHSLAIWSLLASVGIGIAWVRKRKVVSVC